MLSTFCRLARERQSPLADVTGVSMPQLCLTDFYEIGFWLEIKIIAEKQMRLERNAGSFCRLVKLVKNKSSLAEFIGSSETA